MENVDSTTSNDTAYVSLHGTLPQRGRDIPSRFIEPSAHMTPSEIVSTRL
jgi:hypothetical protein